MLALKNKDAPGFETTISRNLRAASTKSTPPPPSSPSRAIDMLYDGKVTELAYCPRLNVALQIELICVPCADEEQGNTWAREQNT